MKQVITLSDNAANRIKEIISNDETKSVGVRVGVKSGGCAGMSYIMEYAKEVNMNLVVINPTAVIGPYFHRHTPSTILFDKLLKGELRVLPPQTFGYVDVRDVALGHVKAYENNNAEGRHILCTKCLDGFELILGGFRWI